MARVQQPTQGPCPPPRDQVDPNAEGGGDTPQDVDGERSNVAALDPQDRCPRGAGHPCHVRLAQPASKPDLPQRGPEPNVVHGPDRARPAFTADALALKPTGCSILEWKQPVHGRPPFVHRGTPRRPRTQPRLSTQGGHLSTHAPTARIATSSGR